MDGKAAAGFRSPKDGPNYRLATLIVCVCAKSHDFDLNGDERYSDYGRLLSMVTDSGFSGWIEVEYEGPGHSPGTPKAVCEPAKALNEKDGCLNTVKLLRKHLGSKLQ